MSSSTWVRNGVERPAANPPPVKLDKEAIMDYAGLLADDVIACAEEEAKGVGGKIGERPVVLRSSYGVNALSTGEWVDVQVLISSEEKEGGREVLASMADGSTVEIVINGARDWKELQAERDSFVRSLYACLERELAEIAASHQDDRSADVQVYADEALARADSFKSSQRGGAPTRDMTLDHVHGGPMFKSLLRLGVRGRAKALKAVYSTLIDAGLI